MNENVSEEAWEELRRPRVGMAGQLYLRLPLHINPPIVPPGLGGDVADYYLYWKDVILVPSVATNGSASYIVWGLADAPAGTEHILSSMSLYELGDKCKRYMESHVFSWEDAMGKTGSAPMFYRCPDCDTWQLNTVYPVAGDVSVTPGMESYNYLGSRDVVGACCPCCRELLPLRCDRLALQEGTCNRMM